MNGYAFAEKTSSDASSETEISEMKKPPVGGFTTLLIIDFIQ